MAKKSLHQRIQEAINENDNDNTFRKALLPVLKQAEDDFDVVFRFGDEKARLAEELMSLTPERVREAYESDSLPERGDPARWVLLLIGGEVHGEVAETVGEDEGGLRDVTLDLAEAAARWVGLDPDEVESWLEDKV